jgi:two-component system, OmpR family, response regulator MprA
MRFQAGVLIIEDEAGVLAALYDALRFHGYWVITASTVQEAEEVRTHLGLERIALVIADVHLTPNPHEQEGYRLYRRWRAAHPALPFVITSGYPSSRDLPDIRDGVVPFLAKPFAIDKLLAVIQEILGSEER